MAEEDDGWSMVVGVWGFLAAGIEPGVKDLTLRRTFRYFGCSHGALSRSVSIVVSPLVFVSSPSLSELSEPRSRSEGPSEGRVALLVEGVGPANGGGGSSGSCHGGLAVALGGVSYTASRPKVVGGSLVVNFCSWSRLAKVKA